ncbi:hypothetical protein [Kitasatospora sp. NPDC048407]|uniref:hypothetical protein n=1 Tax=Kitasatospora sp. NPDC048407 TaxID=3364051 RepID=UPI00372104AF
MTHDGLAPGCSAEEVAEAARLSTAFADVETVEVAEAPRLLDIHLETVTGHEFLVMVSESARLARILFENYVFDDVPTHRILQFLDRIDRQEVNLSLSRNGGQLTLRVRVPEGEWVDRRGVAADLSNWERTALERN